MRLCRVFIIMNIMNIMSIIIMVIMSTMVNLLIIMYHCIKMSPWWRRRHNEIVHRAGQELAALSSWRTAVQLCQESNVLDIWNILDIFDILNVSGMSNYIKNQTFQMFRIFEIFLIFGIFQIYQKWVESQLHYQVGGQECNYVKNEIF